MLYFGFIAIAFLTGSCVARPTNSVVVEKLEKPPAGWIQDESTKVDKDATSITLNIHLTNQGMDKFHELAMNVRRVPSLIVASILSQIDCNAWPRAIW